MGKIKKRRRDDSPPCSTQNHERRSSPNPRHSSYPTFQRRVSSSEPNHQRIDQQHPTGKGPAFPSYIDTPNLPLTVKALCEIIEHTPSLEVDRVLDKTGIRVSTDIVEDVLKLSYAHPASAVKFFRWSGYQLNDRHSPYAWNIVVDMLGKNFSFDAMWDAIKSMKKEGLLSLATFASVFGSYVIADRVEGAIMAFDAMDQYGCVQDIVALNSLLSAICRDGKTIDAKWFLNVVRTKIRPDSDTYAILLEGWENEQDVINAKQTFKEMVDGFGWDPNNLAAYDSFLNTLLKGSDGLRESMKVFETLKDKRCYPGTRFFKAALSECVTTGDLKTAVVLWNEITTQNGCKPDTELYNLMNSLYSYIKDGDVAARMLDEKMVYNGVASTSKPKGKSIGRSKAVAQKPKVAKEDDCFHCGEVGHWKRNCPKYLGELKTGKDTMSEPKGDVVATMLDEMVYNGVASTSKPKGKFIERSKAVTQKPKVAEEHECFHCGEVGHWKRNCLKYLAELKTGKVTTSEPKGDVAAKMLDEMVYNEVASTSKPKGKLIERSKTVAQKPKVAAEHDCFHCGEVGHWKRNCPKYLAELKTGKATASKPKGDVDARMLDEMVYNEVASTSNPKGKFIGRRKVVAKKPKVAEEHDCFHCGEVGHWKRNCPKYLAELKTGKAIGS